nr:protein RETICULATA-RELATED 4, chloroplastic-like [Ipomoea batatas]
MAAAIEAGKIPGMIVHRYFELEKSLILRWLLRFGGFRERLLGDDLFLAKLGMECGVGIFTKIMALVADFMLVWLPAPTVSLRPPLAITAAGGPLTTFFYNCPDNAFQIALAGTSYTFLQRLGALLRNGAKLFAIGTGASVTGTVITNSLIRLRKAIDKSFAREAEDIPILATGAAYGVYMSLSSNLRYQTLAGIIEQRLLEPLLHKEKILLSALCFAFRTGNTFLGSLMWVDFARWIGVQRSRA